VNRVLEAGMRTPDLGGKSTTMQVAKAVAKAIS
jgi:isocitrate/isopropylmalate dehydrogenase